MPSWAIVGATRGIGLGFVQRLSQDRDNEVLAIIRSQSTAGPLNELARASSNIHVIETDTSEPKKLEETASAIGKATGQKLDVLIYNAVLAGTEAKVYPPSKFIGMEQELEQELLLSTRHNVLNVMYTINAFLPLIKNGSEKKIIFISSGIADVDVIRTTAVPFQIGYGVSKAGANTVMAKYAVELAAEGILTLSLSPGWVATDAANELVKDPNVFNFVLEAFRKLDPSVNGMISVKESVEAQLEVIKNLQPSQSGMFLSHHGNKEWL